MGYKPQELLNELCYDYFHPDDLEHMMESYQQGKDCLGGVNKGLDGQANYIYACMNVEQMVGQGTATHCMADSCV